jgi:hypothetical protein
MGLKNGMSGARTHPHGEGYLVGRNGGWVRNWSRFLEFQCSQCVLTKFPSSSQCFHIKFQYMNPTCFSSSQCVPQWVHNSITLYLITLAQSWTLITNIDGSKGVTYAILFWECKLPFWVVFKVWDLIDWLIYFWVIGQSKWLIEKQNKKEKNFWDAPKTNY